MPKQNLINRDYLPRLNAIDAKQSSIRICVISALAAVLTIGNESLIDYAFASHESAKRTVVDAEPDHLVSHDMVKYMMIHAHGQVLTEEDMQ